MAIVDGSVEPEVALARLMQDVVHAHHDSEIDREYVGDSLGLERLVGAYYGYDDLREAPDSVSYAGELYGDEALARLDGDVRDMARAWIDEHTAL